MTRPIHTVRSAPVAVGDGFSIEMTFANGSYACVWTPDMPTPAQGRPLLPAYQRARNAFLARVGEVLGLNIGVADLPAGKGGAS